jgi:hypothetical protein
VCVCAICPGLIHNISRVCHCHLLRLVLSSYFCCDFVVVVSMLALVLPYLFLYLPYPEFFLCLYSMPFYTLRLSFCPCPLSFLHSNATCVCVCASFLLPATISFGLPSSPPSSLHWLFERSFVRCSVHNQHASRCCN